ncbi:DNA methyltransferase [Arthrobacter phage Shambre1]|uniref:DNA methyltransferase n=1 Tax=Arthrobacter phage Shambre1 TaxID=2927284 RepID=A0A977PRT9_9CAUD|nr:DNA methyltransferase [Arthrobacter phage Shambre1]UXE04738.1 DNA methyltransferase [Arthrobacter phage Shambre1]
MTEHRINPGILDKAVPIDLPVPLGKNPRRGDVDKIAKSLMENGQYKPIILRDGTNETLVGNHTLKAARRLGWDKIAAEHIEVTSDAHALQIALVDNAGNDWGTYDKKDLADLLASLPDPTYGTGYDKESVTAAMYGLEQEPAELAEDVDDVPAEPEKPKTRPGDVWELGPHRLVCGDATDPRVLEALMGADVADLMWTDPPYGVEYVGKTKDALRIENDGADGLRKLLDGAFQAAADVLRPGAPVYVAHADTERVNFEGSLRGAGYLVRQNLVWVKNTMVLGHSDYHYKHEPVLQAEAPDYGAGESEPGDSTAESDNVVPIFSGDAGKGPKEHSPLLYGFTAGGTGRLGRGGPRWYGPNNGTTVFEFPKPAASKDHPTMKPVALIAAHLANSLRKGQGIVLDPFAGSGSTMMAADAHGSAARLVELDPRYCDVIAMRWQKHAGEFPRRNGKVVRFPVKAAE